MRCMRLMFAGPVLALLVAATAVAPASAETLRWPAATSLPKPAPPPASPPAVLERAASVSAWQSATLLRPRGYAACQRGQSCVVCIAACDTVSPMVVYQGKIRSTGKVAAAADPAENDSDGVAANAPRFARPAWAGIECGEESGCRVSGVIAPRQPTDSDVRITIIQDRGGSTSRYIDGP